MKDTNDILFLPCTGVQVKFYLQQSVTYFSQDFGSLMRSNILVPLKRISSSNTDGSVEMMRSRLERHTKYWPMIISSTLMFNLKQVCSKKVINQVLTHKSRYNFCSRFR